jgi:hypothetical protein
MSEISRSVQIVKQGKKIVDCIVRTVCMVAKVAGSYDDVAGLYADVAGLSWWTVGSYVDELASDMWHLGGEWIGDTWPKQGPPRVTWSMVKICGVYRTRPHDLQAGVKLWEGSSNRHTHHVVLTTIRFHIYLSLNYILVGRSSSRG